MIRAILRFKKIEEILIESYIQYMRVFLFVTSLQSAKTNGSHNCYRDCEVQL